MGDPAGMLSSSKAEPYWVPPFTVGGLLRRKPIRQAVNDLLNSTIQWRWARAQDWPYCVSGSDFKLAQLEEFGFVAEVDGALFFLVPRGFDWPEWALARHDPKAGSWTRLGYLEPAPYGWFLPALADRDAPD